MPAVSAAGIFIFILGREKDSEMRPTRHHGKFLNEQKGRTGNMANYRRSRINDEVRNEMAVILRGVKDPRVRDAFVSVTAAVVTPDLKFAKIYYSHLYGDPKEISKGLKSSAGYIRYQLAQILNLRATPELTFIPDESIAHGAHIASLINNLEFSDENDDEDDEDGEDGERNQSSKGKDNNAD